ncbi:MAG: ferritin-like domain-containing protein [Actinobacteria bacterium]|nr:ferritin-like domain-containing protein [Actinomycetota bacterium]
MNIPVNDNAFNRRKFLQSGGLALASAAILAACGKSDKVATSYPRIGESPTTTGLPTAHVTDAVLLRTASSLEWCAIDAYTAVAALGLLPSAATSVVKRFQADHKAHAAALTPLIKKAGGEPFECANERINELYIGPAVELITGPAAVPGAFGSLAAVTFSIGKTSEAGTKTQLSLDTPSLNSLAYEYASC